MAPGFEHVRAAFEQIADDLDPGGGSFAAAVDGEFGADLWAGQAAPGMP